MIIRKYACLSMMLSLLWSGGWVPAEAAVEELKIQVVTIPKPESAKEKQDLVIQTDVGAMCLGNIYSEANPNNRSKLPLKNVDRDGKATWAWPISPNKTKGRWAIRVQCATQSKEGEVRVTVEGPE